MKYQQLFQNGLKGIDKEGLCYKGEPYRITGTRVIEQSKQYSRQKREYEHQYIVTLFFEDRNHRVNLLVDYNDTVIPRGKHKGILKDK